MKLPKSFKKLTKEAVKKYRRLKTACEKQVRRWEWTDLSRYSLRPYEFERLGKKYKRGKVIPKKPAKPYGSHQYGFDAEGRMVVDRDMRIEGFGETFFEYGEDHVVEWRFEDPKWLLGATLYSYEDGRLVRLDTVSPVNSYEDYCYVDGMLSEITRFEDGELSVTFKLKHDKKGKLLSISRKAARV